MRRASHALGLGVFVASSMATLALECARRRVCVVGAGAGGLVAASTLRRYGHEVSVFEKSEVVGGIWSRSGAVVYDGLRCNLPHHIMAYRGAPFEASRSFVATADVTAYLERCRTRVIQRRFNVSVPRARVLGKASTLRDRSER